MAGMRSAPASGLRNSKRWPRLWAALAAVAVLAAAGCGSGSVSGRSPAPRALFGTTLTPCAPGGYGGKCRTVWVPQDWAHPHGPQIPLLVAVVPAMAATHPAAPLFILAGWGGSAISGVDWAMQAFGQLNQSMDLVFAVQRGTPFSWPQTCPGLEDRPVSPATMSAAVRRCLASVNRSPRHDTTAAAARDLDQVRKALGYNKINIYGASYGVSMGLAYLQRYGAHVRTAVFSSGSLLNVPLWQLVPVHAQQAFDQVAARCAAAPACARAYHPAADLATVVNRLRAHPARVTITGHSGQPETVTITLPGFLNHVIDDYLASPDTAVLLPGDLHAFARGQWAKVIAERGLASATAAAGAPTQLQRSPSAAATPGPREPREDRPAGPAVPVHPGTWPPRRPGSRNCALCGRTTRECRGWCTATSRSCSSTAPPTRQTRQPTSRPRRAPCPTPCWSPSPAVRIRSLPPAASQPSPPRSSWQASPPTEPAGQHAPAPCSMHTPHSRPHHNAPDRPATGSPSPRARRGSGLPQIRWHARLSGLPPDSRHSRPQSK